LADRNVSVERTRVNTGAAAHAIDLSADLRKMIAINPRPSTQQLASATGDRADLSSAIQVCSR
jgi:hypothetical protein